MVKTKGSRLVRLMVLTIAVRICSGGFCQAAPENFEVLAQLRDGRDFGAFAVSGSLLLVVEGDGLVALDVTDPARPAQLTSLPLDPFTTVTQLLFNGRYAFVRMAERGLFMYDYTTPASPRYIDSLLAYDIHKPTALALDGDRLYFGGRFLQIYDVTDPAAATGLAGHRYNSYKLAVDDGRAIVSWEDFDPVYVYDVRDESNPVLLGELDFRVEAGGERHGAIALEWPDVGMAYSRRTPSGLYPQGVLHFEPGAGGDWTRGEISRTDAEATRLAIGSDKVFALFESRSEITAYDLNSLSPTGRVDGPFTDVATEGDRLYGFDSRRVSIFDAASTSTFPLLGAWSPALGGSVIALSGDRAYVFGAARESVVLDLSDPTSPSMIGTGPIAQTPTAAVVYGNNLLVADAGVGLRALSLADADAPVEAVVAGVSGGAYDLELAGNTALVAGGEELLHVFDLTFPTSPVTVAIIPSYGGVVRSCGIGVKGGYAYLLGRELPRGDTYLVIVDIRNPRSPSIVSARYLRPYGFHARSDLAIAGDTLFTFLYGYSNGDAFDVTDPVAPVRIGDSSSGYAMATEGDWLFVATRNDGLHAYSVFDNRTIWDGGYFENRFSGITTSGSLVCGVSEKGGLDVLQFSPPEPVDILPLDFDLATTTVQFGRTIDFAGRVRNSGPAATTQSFWIEFYGIPMDRPGDMVFLCDSLSVPGGLAAGAEVSLSGLGRTLYTPERGLLAGRYAVAIVIDQANVVPEAREENNVELAPLGLDVVPAPFDLRPTRFEYSPDRITGGQLITLSGSITYEDVTKSNAGFYVDFLCSPNADFSPPRYTLCNWLWIGPGLEPGVEHDFSATRQVYTNHYGLPPGIYVVGAVVDPTELVGERDETNNTLWQSAFRLIIDAPELSAGRNWEHYR